MARTPESVSAFLSGRRLAVAGVSRDSRQPANHIYRRLRDVGYEVAATNPGAREVEGDPCYPDLASVPGRLDGVVIATPPNVTEEVVRACAERGVTRVWIHRSFGQGSVSDEAVTWARAQGMEVIVGGCPMMFCEPVDFGHRCMAWLLGLRGRIEG
ncbi:MAG TPA: CoA-binding protein [Longimicrobiales bacterium]|nr:CoA-binding protein [Longimicrobiales bacterium]